MKVITGNLIKLAINGDFDVIIHGCNCFCKMGAGIAKQIASPPRIAVSNIVTREGQSLGFFVEAAKTINERAIELVRSASSQQGTHHQHRTRH